MITLITGTPGAGKSLHAVWELLRHVPGSFIEQDGERVPRRLLCNVKNLLVEHELLTPEMMNTWHEWCKPGDVIAFDEVQEVWRPRGMGVKVPDCIAKLETHRHMGVDFVLITQHPQLLDQNIRKLVGRHLHVRRVSNFGLAVVYEWDHAANPAQTKHAISMRAWRYPGKKGFALYKSSQLHTKQSRRVPLPVLMTGAALAGIAYMAPGTMAMMSDRMAGKTPATSSQAQAKGPAAAASGVPPQAAAPAVVTSGPAVLPAAPRPQHLGCIAFGPRCECYGGDGLRVQVERDVCEEGSHRVGYVLPSTQASTTPQAQ
jgi:zona occludens toxin